jgi:hypothetical protein
MFAADAGPHSTGDPGLTDAPVAISGLFPVEADGRFGGTVRTQQTTVELAGALSGSDDVQGTLCIDVVLVYRGTPRRCSSGPVSWSATLVPPAY